MAGWLDWWKQGISAVTLIWTYTVLIEFVIHFTKHRMNNMKEIHSILLHPCSLWVVIWNFSRHVFAPYLRAIYFCIIKRGRINGSLLPLHGASLFCGWGKGIQIWKVAENILNMQSRITEKGWSSRFGVGRGAKTSSPWTSTMSRTTWQKFFLLFHMSVKLGLWHWLRNVGWGWKRLGCWGRYLGLRRTK